MRALDVTGHASNSLLDWGAIGALRGSVEPHDCSSA
jgi:hypothetical protein